MNLPPDGVDLWLVSLDRSEAALRALGRALSGDERRRAEGYHARSDRDRFVAARGYLRLILGRYLGRAPGALRFRSEARGKPALETEDGGLRFNLSHSGGFAVYGVTKRGRIGVDVEDVRTDFDFERVARRCFAPRERAALASCPEGRRREAFFAYWTCKEAYAKALGEGLALPFDRFEVSDLAAPAAGWSLRRVDAGAGRRAAFAVEGSGLSGWRTRTC